VIELRRQGLSTYEISAQLATEGTLLNRTSVGEILAEEGFGRLLRHPESMASTSPATPGRNTRLPRAARLDFARWPATVETAKAGLLLLVPELIALDVPALVNPRWLSRHPRRSRPVLGVVVARPEADPHQAGIPRR
jgi:hypothetical protein